MSAASPAQLALGASGELVGVQYSTTDVDASLGAVRSIWTQALSGDALMETDEQTLAGELGAERKVLLRYHGALPLSVVSGWMGGTLADDRIKVETLFYSADSGTLFGAHAGRRTLSLPCGGRPRRLRPGAGGLSRHGLCICGRGYERLSRNAAV